MPPPPPPRPPRGQSRTEDAASASASASPRPPDAPRPPRGQRRTEGAASASASAPPPPPPPPPLARRSPPRRRSPLLSMYVQVHAPARTSASRVLRAPASHTPLRRAPRAAAEAEAAEPEAEAEAAEAEAEAPELAVLTARATMAESLKAPAEVCSLRRHARRQPHHHRLRLLQAQKAAVACAPAIPPARRILPAHSVADSVARSRSLRPGVGPA